MNIMVSAEVHLNENILTKNLTPLNPLFIGPNRNHCIVISSYDPWKCPLY